MAKKLQKVVVGISGGVDSAVSAYLLKEQGYDVTGVYMWCYGSNDEHCRAHQDRADAIKVASHLNIPFEVWDFEKEYSEKVLKYFYDEYQNGRTPNPDVVCNKEIKFGMFYERAIKERGFDYVATGHYARKIQSLGTGADPKKDQSYFLYRIKPEQLPYILFPVGELTKKEVREIAKKAGLPVYNKPDSQGVCFVGEVSLRKFLEGKVTYQKGNIVDTKGEVIGSHEGLPFYTIGQRRGFTLTKYQGLPLYVISKNMERNELVVGFGKETEVGEFKVGDINWLVEFNSGSSHPPAGGRTNPYECFGDLKVRIRHLSKPVSCELEALSRSQIRVKLKIPQRGVAPGQSAVFYHNDIVIGGGIIQ
ncbi:MAG: tRNA 2-thiouridine(34) synthase MnmA [Patescibacteria group bacterium]